jgi:hypothetical protein
MEIVRERLEREFNLDLISTAPNVEYRVHRWRTARRAHRHNPSELPEGKIDFIEEPSSRPRSSRRASTSARSWSCARPGAATCGHGLPVARAGGDALHAAAGRDRLRLLRPAEVAHPGLRQPRLRARRRPGRRPGQGRHPAARRARRRLQRRSCTRTRPTPTASRWREAQGAHPAAAVRGADPGGHRRQDHRPRDGPRHPQGRARQVLRRRHHPQAQAAREAEGGQEAHEDGRPRRGPPGGLHRRSDEIETKK